MNVSSPNTPGLRLLQDVETLRPLLAAVGEEADTAAGRHVPLLVKIAPDLSDEDIDDVARLALDLKLDGIIATNTTIARNGLASGPDKVEACGAGGLSGAPLKARSLEVLTRLKSVTGGALTLVSVGGVETGAGCAGTAGRRRHPRPGLHGFPVRGPLLGRPHQPAAGQPPEPALGISRDRAPDPSQQTRSPRQMTAGGFSVEELWERMIRRGTRRG